VTTTFFAPATGTRNHAKWALFGAMALLAILAVQADERFLIDRTDPEWKHIAAFKWWLLPHGLAGVTALCLGPFQFSERIRKGNPGVHRLMGRIYLGAIVVASLLSIYITLRFEPHPFQVEIWAQGGGWFLCAALAYIYARKRNFVLHRQWVARSYGFTFIFIMARVPDAFHVHWPNETEFVEYLWMLVFVALIVPDLILQSGELLKRRTVKVR
jgi:uncharacterized membrane protein